MQMNLGVRWREPRLSQQDADDGRGSVRRVGKDNYYYFYELNSAVGLGQLSDFEKTTFQALDTKFVRRLWVPDLYVSNMKYGSRVLTDYDGRLFVLNGREIFYRQVHAVV